MPTRKAEQILGISKKINLENSLNQLIKHPHIHQNKSTKQIYTFRIKVPNTLPTSRLLPTFQFCCYTTAAAPVLRSDENNTHKSFNRKKIDGNIHSIEKRKYSKRVCNQIDRIQIEHT